MYLCTRRKIWTSFSCLVLLKWYHVVFSQFKFPANFAHLVVPKMHCLYANAVVQLSMQHCPCYMAWKTEVHTWCRHRHLCINALMLREKKNGCKDLLTLPRTSGKLAVTASRTCWSWYICIFVWLLVSMVSSDTTKWIAHSTLLLASRKGT